MKKFEEGVHFDMAEGFYFGEATVKWFNRSKMVKVDQLTIDELLDCDYTPSSSTALRVGKAVHAAWLENKYEWEVIENLRTNVGKEQKARCIAEDILYLSKTEERTTMALINGLEKSQACRDIKKVMFGAEVTILDNDYNGIPAKIRLDGLTKDGWIIDLKTTSAELTKESILETFRKFAYKYQVVMYSDVARKWCKELGIPELKGFKFVFVSKVNNKAAVVTVDGLDHGPVQAEMLEKCERLKVKLSNHEAGIQEPEESIELFETPQYLTFSLDDVGKLEMRLKQIEKHLNL